MNQRNAIIVDDEKEACINLDFLLKEYTKNIINVLGFAYSAKEAGKAIEALKPDVIFLDIEMPNENAFQFLERLESIDFEIIFVTAYDEYAIRAFKLNAIDYILKPINADDLIIAVEKLKDRIIYKKILHSNPKAYHNLANEINKREKPKQIILRDNNQSEIISIQDILYIKAMGSYSQIVFKQHQVFKQILMSNPIALYEEMLSDISFFRVHRSFLVNCNHIKKIIKSETTSIQIIDGNILPVGRRRYPEMMVFLKKFEKNA
jgi:two-component system LytT family response regulator